MIKNNRAPRGGRSFVHFISLLPQSKHYSRQFINIYFQFLGLASTVSSSFSNSLSQVQLREPMPREFQRMQIRNTSFMKYLFQGVWNAYCVWTVYKLNRPGQ